jgi:cysteine desulfurase/selenocysteine lyase
VNPVRSIADASTAARPYDVEAVRRDFPALHQQVHGKPLVYLDNAATTHKPQAVIDAIVDFYTKDNSNVHRGVHELSVRATDAYEGARDKVRRFIGAASEREIVFVRGTTEGINLVARGFVASRLQAGDEILITALEHHSDIVPWQLLCESTGARLKVVPIEDSGEVRLEAFTRALGPRTRFVAFSWVSNALGTILPVQAMIAAAHAQGVPVLVDAAQAVPHLPVDVQAVDADFLVFSGHKLYGPTGIGILYGKQAHLEAMPPWQGGGDMIASVTFEKSTWNRLPWKFEAGTPDIAGGIGLGAAIDYVQRLGIEAIGAHEAELLRQATAQLEGLPGLRILGTAPQKGCGGVVRDRRHPPARHRHDPRPAGNRDPHRPPLRAAGDGPFRCAGDGARFVRALQHARGSGRAARRRRPGDRHAGTGWAMSDDLRDLYQEVILEHARKPRNFRKIEGSGARRAEGYNRLCGDRLNVYVLVEGGVVQDVSFEGSGCAISTASASMMTQSLKGKTESEAEALFERFPPPGDGRRRRRGGQRAAGEARNLRGRARVPGTRQVREPRLAHDARSTAEGKRCGCFDGRLKTCRAATSA